MLNRDSFRLVQNSRELCKVNVVQNLQPPIGNCLYQFIICYLFSQNSGDINFHFSMDFINWTLYVDTIQTIKELIDING